VGERAKANEVTTSGAPELTLTRPAPNVFRFAPDAAQSVAGAGSYAYRELGWRTAAIVADDIPYSWEGAAGCLVACLAWAACVTQAAGLPWQVTVTGAVVATLVEALPIPLDDNLGITLAAGYTMKLMAG